MAVETPVAFSASLQIASRRARRRVAKPTACAIPIDEEKDTKTVLRRSEILSVLGCQSLATTPDVDYHEGSAETSGASTRGVSRRSYGSGSPRLAC